MFDYQCIFCTKEVSKQTNKRTKFRTRLSVRQTFGLESRSRELCEYDGKYTMGSLLYHTNVPSVAVLSVFLPLSFTPSIASFPPSFFLRCFLSFSKSDDGKILAFTKLRFTPDGDSPADPVQKLRERIAKGDNTAKRTITRGTLHGEQVELVNVTMIIGVCLV